MRDNVSLSTYKEAMDYKRVLAIHMFIVLVARPRAVVEDARSGRILDSHCRHDGRRHRHYVSHGPPVTKKSSKIVFETRTWGSPIVARESGDDVFQRAPDWLGTFRQFIILKGSVILWGELSWRDRPDNL